MKNNFKKILSIIYGVLITSLVLTAIIRQVNITFTVVLAVWLTMLFYCISDIKKHIITLFFNIAFFVFLLGGYFNAKFLGYTRHLVFFNQKIESHMYISLLIALCGLFLGNLLKLNLKNNRLDKLRAKPLNTLNTLPDDLTDILKKVCLCGYFITFIPYIIIQGIKVYYSISKGYTGIYLFDISSVVPYAIRLAAYMCPVFFYAFLACMPQKKECIAPVSLYLFYDVLTLGSGQRAGFVINIMLIFIYFCLRSFKNNNEHWINKKILIILAVLAPVSVVGLNILGNIRFGKTIHFNGLFKTVLDVFNAQGISIAVIGYGKSFAYKIPDKLYSFGSVTEFLKYNPISNAVFHFKQYSGQSPERALNGNLFAHIISYFAIPLDYQSGKGMGSSFIAEAFHDFGYIGVFFISLIYGKILQLCDKFNSTDIFNRFIILMIFSALIMAPRGTADAFISNLLNIEIFIAIFLIVFITFVIYKLKIKRANKQIG